TFLSNTATTSGGAVYNDKTLRAENSTFYGNSAAQGGGIYNNAEFTATNSTFVANTGSTSGGGINSGATLALRNSLISASTGGDCVSTGTIFVNANNLVADGSCGAGLSGDPLLGDFGNYGGDTQTVPLLPGSPAIDAGDGATCLATDQRGVARPVGS